MPQHLRRPQCLFVVVAALAGATWMSPATADEPLGVQVPDGFEVNLFAGDELAHDIYCMTTDSLGRVVVSGPGYVRILIDADKDGRAESYKQFADGPASGAQGMYFHGRDLLCIGDAGLIRYRDRDGDDRADGPPDVFLKLKTGSEHHAHAIQKGPDGWWYLIAGNFAEITETYATLPSSPIRKPQSGVLMRFKPDLSGGEIVSDGFRNAYDFAFNSQGDVFVYDSDDERDASLPSYRPTRVFHALPASNAGWVSRSWRRPDFYVDMPPVVASTGRGSPTGVLCYRHTHFPEPYRDALFILDWTFGRVLAMPLTQSGASWTSKPVSFMTGVGQFGFAPTDVEVGPDGSLYVSIGGRGTRGSVFRVRAKETAEAPSPAEEPPAKDDAAPEISETSATEGPALIGPGIVLAAVVDPPADPLTRCLRAPMPLTSWSRQQWEPLAREAGRDALLEAAQSEERPVAERVRAIEILTELFGGLTLADVSHLADTPSADVRARAIWSYGRTQAVDASAIVAFLRDDDPLVVRFALEALLTVPASTDIAAAVPALMRTLSHENPACRMTAVRVLARRSPEWLGRLSFTRDVVVPQANIALALARLSASAGIDEQALEVGLRALETPYPVAVKLEAVRLIQLALGDTGPGSKLPPMFDGYCGPVDLVEHERVLDPVRTRLAKLFPTGDETLDTELSRTLAMLAPFNAGLLDRVLAKITTESHPVDDIHYLTVAARIPVDRNILQRRGIATALVTLEGKIVGRKLNQDTNWEPRIAEMYKRHVELDPALPATIVGQPEFGRPGHVLFLRDVKTNLSRPADIVDAFVRRIEANPDYRWTNDVVFVVGGSSDPRHREMVRVQFENFAVRGAVLMSLAEHPEEHDRAKYLDGLDSSQVEVLSACLQALEKLSPDSAAVEQFALLRTLRRLGRDEREYPPREAIIRLLQRNTGVEFGFVFGKEGHRPQAEAVAQWAAYLERRYPQEAARQAEGTDLEQLTAQLAAVDWSAGNAARGLALFEKRSCAQCHGGRQALGPDLAGVARRFSRDDLFTAVAVPDRDVSPRYQTTMIQTDKGKVYTGLIIYESKEGLILRDGQNQTYRIEAPEIEARRILNSSLMPAGLMKDLKPEDLADLYAYLQSL